MDRSPFVYLLTSLWGFGLFVAIRNNAALIIYIQVFM